MMTQFTKIKNRSGTTNEITKERIFSTLSNQRRRYAVHHLKQVGESVKVRELIEQVAAWENSKSKEELTSKERKRVYISFQQGHLKTLENVGMIEYDQKEDLVTPTELLLNTDIYMEIVPPNSISWGYYYLFLTGLNLVLLLLSWYEVGILANVPPLHIAGIIVLIYAISAAVQTIHSKHLQLGDDGPPPEAQFDEKPRLADSFR